MVSGRLAAGTSLCTSVRAWTGWLEAGRELSRELPNTSGEASSNTLARTASECRGALHAQPWTIGQISTACPWGAWGQPSAAALPSPAATQPRVLHAPARSHSSGYATRSYSCSGSSGIQLTNGAPLSSHDVADSQHAPLLADLGALARDWRQHAVTANRRRTNRSSEASSDGNTSCSGGSAAPAPAPPGAWDPGGTNRLDGALPIPLPLIERTCTLLDKRRGKGVFAADAHGGADAAAAATNANAAACGAATEALSEIITSVASCIPREGRPPPPDLVRSLVSAATAAAHAAPWPQAAAMLQGLVRMRAVGKRFLDRILTRTQHITLGMASSGLAARAGGGGGAARAMHKRAPAAGATGSPSAAGATGGPRGEAAPSALDAVSLLRSLSTLHAMTSAGAAANIGGAMQRLMLHLQARLHALPGPAPLLGLLRDVTSCGWRHDRAPEFLRRIGNYLSARPPPRSEAAAGLTGSRRGGSSVRPHGDDDDISALARPPRLLALTPTQVVEVLDLYARAGVYHCDLMERGLDAVDRCLPALTPSQAARVAEACARFTHHRPALTRRLGLYVAAHVGLPQPWLPSADGAGGDCSLPAVVGGVPMAPGDVAAAVAALARCKVREERFLDAVAAYAGAHAGVLLADVEARRARAAAAVVAAGSELLQAQAGTPEGGVVGGTAAVPGAVAAATQATAIAVLQLHQAPREAAERQLGASTLEAVHDQAVAAHEAAGAAVSRLEHLDLGIRDRRLDAAGAVARQASAPAESAGVRMLEGYCTAGGVGAHGTRSAALQVPLGASSTANKEDGNLARIGAAPSAELTEPTRKGVPAFQDVAQAQLVARMGVSDERSHVRDRCTAVADDEVALRAPALPPEPGAAPSFPPVEHGRPQGAPPPEHTPPVTGGHDTRLHSSPSTQQQPGAWRGGASDGRWTRPEGDGSAAPLAHRAPARAKDAQHFPQRREAAVAGSGTAAPSGGAAAVDPASSSWRVSLARDRTGLVIRRLSPALRPRELLTELLAVPGTDIDLYYMPYDYAAVSKGRPGLGCAFLSVTSPEGVQALARRLLAGPLCGGAELAVLEYLPPPNSEALLRALLLPHSVYRPPRSEAASRPLLLYVSGVLRGRVQLLEPRDVDTYDLRTVRTQPSHGMFNLAQLYHHHHHHQPQQKQLPQRRRAPPQPRVRAAASEKHGAAHARAFGCQPWRQDCGARLPPPAADHQATDDGGRTTLRSTQQSKDLRPHQDPPPLLSQLASCPMLGPPQLALIAHSMAVLSYHPPHMLETLARLMRSLLGPVLRQPCLAASMLPPAESATDGAAVADGDGPPATHIQPPLPPLKSVLHALHALASQPQPDPAAFGDLADVCAAALSAWAPRSCGKESIGVTAGSRAAAPQGPGSSSGVPTALPSGAVSAAAELPPSEVLDMHVKLLAQVLAGAADHGALLYHPRLCDAAAALLRHQLRHLRMRAACALLQSLVRLRHPPARRLVAAVAPLLAQDAARLSPSSLVDLGWSCARTGLRDAECAVDGGSGSGDSGGGGGVVRALAKRTRQLMQQLPTSGLVQMFWALAALQHDGGGYRGRAGRAAGGGSGGGTCRARSDLHWQLLRALLQRYDLVARDLLLLQEGMELRRRWQQQQRSSPGPPTDAAAEAVELAMESFLQELLYRSGVSTHEVPAAAVGSGGVAGPAGLAIAAAAAPQLPARAEAAPSEPIVMATALQQQQQQQGGGTAARGQPSTVPSEFGGASAGGPALGRRGAASKASVPAVAVGRSVSAAEPAAVGTPSPCEGEAVVDTGVSEHCPRPPASCSSLSLPLLPLLTGPKATVGNWQERGRGAPVFAADRADGSLEGPRSAAATTEIPSQHVTAIIATAPCGGDTMRGLGLSLIATTHDSPSRIGGSVVSSSNSSTSDSDSSRSGSGGAADRSAAAAEIPAAIAAAGCASAGGQSDNAAAAVDGGLPREILVARRGLALEGADGRVMRLQVPDSRLSRSASVSSASSSA